MTTIRVIEAEAALEKARSEALEERVEQSRKQLKQLRADAKKLRAEYAKIAGEVRDGDAIVTNTRRQLYSIDAEIAQLSSVRGRNPLDDDPEDRSAQVEELRELRAEVKAKCDAGLQMTAHRIRAVEITQQLQVMQVQAANLQNIIEHGGKMGKALEGGNFNVA